jgi:hypothetical protein
MVFESASQCGRWYQGFTPSRQDAKESLAFGRVAPIQALRPRLRRKNGA